MQEKLDLKDRRILTELDFNARISASSLAKKVGLTKAAVINRVKRLEEKKIITNYSLVIDTSRLGYVNYIASVKFKNTSKQKREEILSYAMNYPKVWGLLESVGFFDLTMAFAARGNHDFFKIWKEFIKPIKKFLDVKRIVEIFDYSQYPKSYILGEKNNKEIILFDTSDKFSIDNEDKLILKILSENSRQTITDIAKKTNLSSKKVLYRIKKLERQGVIKGYRTEIDFGKLGYTYFKIFVNFDNSEAMEKAEAFVKAHPNFTYHQRFLGGYDLEADMECKGIYHFEEIMRELDELLGSSITEYEFFNCYRWPKNVYYVE